MNKKYFMLLFSMILLVGILMACNSEDEEATSGSDSESSENTEETESENEGEAESEEPVKLMFHTHGNEASYNWSETIPAFEEANPGIEVELVILSEKGDTNEALQKLDLAASSGEQLDVLMFSDPASYAQRVDLGMVAPIDEFIEEEGYEVTEEYKVNTQLGDNYYALPGKFNPWYVLVNKDHLDEAGLEMPTDWTWDEYADYAKQLTTDDHYGTFFHGPQNGGWMEYMKLALASESENTDLLKEDGTSNFENPLFKKTLELRWQMEKEDQSATPYTDIMSQQLHYRDQFFNQDASLVMIGSWMNTELGGSDQFPLEFNVGVAPYPKNNSDDEGGYTPVTTDYMAVASNSEHKEAAYKFIRWYTTEGQVIQGKNIPSWNGVGDDELENIVNIILDDTSSPEKVDKEALISVLKNSKASKLVPPAPYQAEIYEMVNDEYEKLIYEEQDIDATIDAMHEQAQEIIANNE
ncbi:carbohydrate ABC transporter substrate-binding protein (CUT1 family) [Saliterribacillus persicus]|uniref:Carbohydrate ABC transporter substrate-binding protein (CUT1 family) n=2 Tax=Saliterribacillus persicus TaxID=930114 RepID=A0A368Y3Y3_9BACI|nr:extracellular solute-binding protein [Saliterribacillus persicus]RCW74815.1 carbohydrate ABC transporter substrate-binding protein (CUT1 family) [Saliterribacillus persicus]